MKVLLINGSPHEKGCTYTALSLIAGELKAQGIETEILHVGVDALPELVEQHADPSPAIFFHAAPPFAFTNGRASGNIVRKQTIF